MRIFTCNLLEKSTFSASMYINTFDVCGHVLAGISCTVVWAVWLLSGSPDTGKDRFPSCPQICNNSFSSHWLAAEVVTWNNRGMEGSSKPDHTSLDWGTKSATPSPPLSDRLEKLHSQTDSFLVAARIVRRGWLDEGKKIKRFSQSDGSAHQNIFTGSEGDQAPNWVRISRPDPRTGWAADTNSIKTAQDGKPGSEKYEKGKQTSEGAVSPKTQAERQAGVVYVWKSGCRITARQTRRFKAPMLPAIAEI